MAKQSNNNTEQYPWELFVRAATSKLMKHGTAAGFPSPAKRPGGVRGNQESVIRGSDFLGF